MVWKTKKPTRAAVEARPSVISDDIFAGRKVRQMVSGEQALPVDDNRHRVTYSERFYVVQLMGTWVNVVESAERSVRYRNRLRWVTFENKEFELKRAEQFIPFVGRFIQFGCYAYIGGKEIHAEKALKKLVSQPFIYIASSESLSIFNDLKKQAQSSR
jgi:hypothetical protein